MATQSEHRAPPARTIAADATIKLLSRLAVAALALLTSIVTARRLGAGGKGVVSTVGYLLVLAVATAELGLGEAGVLMSGRRGHPSRHTVSVSLTAALGVSVVAAVGLVGGLAVLYHAELGELRVGLLATALAVPVATVTQASYPLIEAERRFDLAAYLRTGVALVTAVATVLLIEDHWTTGALVAATAGWALGAVGAYLMLARLGVRPRLTFDRAFLASAVRVGAPIQLSRLLVMAGARLDVIPVVVFAGRSAVGYYSVGLTIASVAAYPASSVVTASYPRLTRADPDRVGIETAALARRAAVAGVLSMLLLGLAAPLVVPLAFGHGFRPAIGLTLLLLPGTAAYAVQLAVGYACTAFDRTRVLVVSFAASLVAMLLGDVTLVPAFGATGAAIASTASNVVGLVVAVNLARGIHGGGLRPYVPGGEDVRAFASLVRSTARVRRRPRP